MSYRNDHDAALARVDALQAEVTRMRNAEAVRTRATREPRARRLRRWLGGIAALGAVGGTLFVAGLAASSPSPDESRISGLDTRISRATLDSCIAQIRPAPTVASDRLTPAQAVAIELTGAPCRSNLGDLIAEGLWAPGERTALVTWRASEDRLANAITMVSTYHQSNPARLDGYSSSPQLWREYERALADRDAALGAWQRLR